MRKTLHKSRKYRLVIAFILSISLCITPMNAFALDSITTQPMLPVPTAEETSASVNAISYSISPDHLYPFIYKGFAPSFWQEIDTVNCTINHLYVHNANTNQVLPIGEANVVEFTTTKDHLFYVTENQQIIRTDYNASTHITLYSAASGEITSLDYYNGILYFIEDGNKVILLDAVTGQSTIALNRQGLCSLFFFDDDKFIWWNTNNEPFYYNVSSKAEVAFESELELTSLIASYTTLATEENTNAELLNSQTPENDVNFPLTEYPARMVVYSWPYPEALTYFRNSSNKTTPGCYHNPNDSSAYYRDCRSYAGSNECDGFAKFAHLMYIHRYDSEYSWPYDTSADTITCHIEYDDEVDVRNFFQGLSEGAFVRFGKIQTGTTSCAEQHSAVFSATSTASVGEGVWLYECNQDWKCGVFYTFYPYSFLASHYHCTRAAVNHTFTGSKTIHSATKHKQYCVNCSGYLVQSHTGTKYAGAIDGARHELWYPCCSGIIYQAHTFSYGECTECGYS